MKKANETKNVRNSCTATGLNQRFKDHNVTLERIEKSLEKYLETKRNQVCGSHVVDVFSPINS